MQFSAGLSPDRMTAKLVLSQEHGKASIVNAEQLEELISTLSKLRAQMAPEASQCESPLARPTPPIDAKSPRIDVALIPGPTCQAAVAVAFPGLGWRTLTLSQAECEALGRMLLTTSASHSQNPN